MQGSGRRTRLGVPLMPSYTLSDPKGLGFGVELDNGESIQAAVRYVDHIQHRNATADKPGETLSPGWPPYDDQLDIGKTDTADDAVKGILKGLKVFAKNGAYEHADDEGEALRGLLKRSDWKLQLWVLPQGQRTL